MDFVTLLPRVWIILQTLAADHIGVITAVHIVGVVSGGVAFDGALGDVPTVFAWHAAQHARMVDVVCGAAAVDQPEAQVGIAPIALITPLSVSVAFAVATQDPAVLALNDHGDLERVRDAAVTASLEVGHRERAHDAEVDVHEKVEGTAHERTHRPVVWEPRPQGGDERWTALTPHAIQLGVPDAAPALIRGPTSKCSPRTVLILRLEHDVEEVAR
eukprot:scaffold38751_cov45-Phaeocystis_antarctica.AAC.3